MTPTASAASPAALTNAQLMMITLNRMVLTTFYRLIYPLLPLISQKYQVSSGTASFIVTALVITGLLSPLAGAMADVHGERRGMLIGMGLLLLGALCCAFASSFAGFIVGYLLGGLAIALFQPSAQSYLSARTSYQRRGWALGIYELSWAGSALVGVAPLMGLVDQQGISIAFWVLVVVALIGLVSLTTLPTPPVAPSRSDTRPAFDWQALRQPRVLALIVLFLCSGVAMDSYFVSQSSWLVDQFQADAVQLGQVFAVLGIAEFGGALCVTLFVDRIGKKRAVVISYGLVALSLMALPFTEGQWIWLLPVLFIAIFLFEFAIVASFPLASGLVPHMRGTVLSLAGAGVGIGRTVGSLVAEPLRLGYGMIANTGLGALLVIVGMLATWRYVRETEHEQMR